MMAVISSQGKENQILLNHFSVWCQWANMIIRVDKCSSFGIKKHLSKSIQYQPKLFVNKTHIQNFFQGGCRLFGADFYGSVFYSPAPKWINKLEDSVYLHN